MIAAGSALLCGHQLGEALVPVVVGAIVGRAVAGADGPALAVGLLVLAADFLALSLCYRFGARLGARARLQIEHDVRMRLVSRALDDGGGVRVPVGALLATATSDARRVGQVARQAMSVVAAVVVVVFSLVTLVLVQPFLAAVVGVGAVVAAAAMLLVSAPLDRRSAHEQRENAATAALGTELVRSQQSLSALGAEDAAITRYTAQSRRSLRGTLRAGGYLADLSGLGALIGGAYLVLTCGVAASFALRGEIGTGALISVVGLAQFVVGPLTTIGKFGATIARGRASSRRVAEVVREPVALTASGALPPGVPELRLVALTLGSAGPVDAVIPAGRLVGIAIPDPAAARELVDLLAAERPPASGAILLGGAELVRTDPAAWRRAVRVCAHDDALFGGTVEEELRGASADAVSAAGMDELLVRLPLGMRTPVGEGGGALSGGERQRVVLARALGAGSPVLVLHEPTTALDSVTEARVAEGIRRLRSGMTTVVVSTSPMLLDACDEVLFVDAHRSARASHGELADTEPGYREAVLG